MSPTENLRNVLVFFLGGLEPTNEATVSSSYWAVLVEWSSLEQVSSSQFSHPYRAALPRSVDRSRSRKKYNSARESQRLTIDVWQTLMTSTGPERDKTGKTIGKFKKNDRLQLWEPC